MGAYHYTAKDMKSRTKKGVIEADSLRHARQLLREKNLLPLSVEAVSGKGTAAKEEKSDIRSGGWFKSKVTAKDMALMMRQLSTLIKSSMPLDEALLAISEQTEKKHIAAILLGVRAKVMEGRSLASAMAAFPKVFSPLYCTTVESGEHSGKLDYVLTELAMYSEKQNALKQQVRQALMYPCMVMLVSLLVVVFLLTDVVPKIVTVFTQSKQALPMATVILIAMSSFIRHYGYLLLIAIFVLLFIFNRLLKRPTVRMKVDRFLLRIPIIGHQIKMIKRCSICTHFRYIEFLRRRYADVFAGSK